MTRALLASKRPGVSAWALCALVLTVVVLWGRTIQQLSVDWSVNEQYTYGWSVPFLCLLLLWRRLQPVGLALTPNLNRNPSASFPIGAPTSGPAAASQPETHNPKLETSELPHQQSPVPVSSPVGRDSVEPSGVQSSKFVLGHSSFVIRHSSFLLLSLAFLFTRWIAEANPDWRLVSWALASITVALSLLLVDSVGPKGISRKAAFPLLFFLTAVPWPTAIEHPLIQGLTRGVVATTTELLNALGTPAIPHGNTIETVGGTVDVDEACSGIRSFQVALMLALFFGEWRRLTTSRRAVLVGFALAFACLFNLGRTFLLSYIAAGQGADAATHWHDPASIAILLGCFCGIWSLATWLAPRSPVSPNLTLNPNSETGMGSAPVSRASSGVPPELCSHQLSPGPGGEKSVGRAFRRDAKKHTPEACAPLDGSSSLVPTSEFGLNPNLNPSPTAPIAPSSVQGSEFRVQSSKFVLGHSSFVIRHSSLLLLALLLLLGEIAIALWYASPSARPGSGWRAELPRGNPTFKEVPLPPAARKILRFNEAISGSWQHGDGTRWQMIYLRWYPGRVAVTLARNHTPEICLPAAGRNLRSMSDVAPVSAVGALIPFRCYTTLQQDRPVFVFYTLWEDGSRDQQLASASLTWQARWAAVRDRRRNPGQRVLQIAIVGAGDQAHAEQLLHGQLPRLLRADPPTT